MSSAHFLLDSKESLAKAMTDRIYNDLPDLVERYGERGRQKTLQDMQYNIEHLAPAVDMGEPSMFATYVTWLDELLCSRNVPTDVTLHSLKVMGDVLAENLDESQMSQVRPVLEAGLAVLTEKK